MGWTVKFILGFTLPWCLAVKASAQTATTRPVGGVAVHMSTTQPVRDVDGRVVDPFQLEPDRVAVVLLFISVDCPVSNSYAPLLAEMGRTFEPKGVRFFLVYSDADLTADAAKQHRVQYALPGTSLLDPHQSLAILTDAHVTPEAVVLDHDDGIQYRGRIDDLYVTVGHKRYAAVHHELSDVLNELVASKPVTVASMPAVGCAFR